MTPEDIFLGPLLRRADQDGVVVALMTFKPFDLRFSVMRADGGPRLAHDAEPLRIRVFDRLYAYFARIRPDRDQAPLPAGVLLTYSIAIRTGSTDDPTAFESLVATDALAYPPHTLPTFVLQDRSRPLTLFYGSCRKIHDAHGGDALAEGDNLIARAPSRAEGRPTILVLGGDQIYADDVDDMAMRHVRSLARQLEGDSPETLPGPRLPADRRTVLAKVARFTSDDLKNQLATLAEYLALYGLSWNIRNWTHPPLQLAHFTSTLPKVRRLLANVPTYMIFDDHDVTDDWNLCVTWREAVWRAPLGRRIIANALTAYWLCQGYGNDPDATDAHATAELVSLIEERQTRYPAVERAFWEFDRWEFSTPTTPFVYFLDTRTQRGRQDDHASNGSAKGAPAFLKSVRSWATTMARLHPLLRQQARGEPIVFVSAAPIFGFEWIDFFQKFLTFFTGPYKFDYESWAANEAQMAHLLKLLSGRNVILLSGDVHYGYTSTVSYTVFDSRRLRTGAASISPTGALWSAPIGAEPSYRVVATSQILQLTSSALKNVAGGWKTRWPAKLSRTGAGQILSDDGSVINGHYVQGRFLLVEDVVEDPRGGLVPRQQEYVVRTPQQVRPVTAYRQHINDEYNSPYLERHNLGVMLIRGPAVRHWFVTPNGNESEHTFDFTNPRYFS